MPSRLWLLFVGVVGLTAGCAQTAVRDCHRADWFYVGQRDALVGAPLDIFETYQAACRETGIEPDRAAYENGRREGLQLYCTDENGFRAGRSRVPYHYICPPDLEKAFLAGRARGLRLSGCRAETYVFDEHLASLEKAIRQLERRLSGPSLPAAEKDRLQQELKDLEARYQQTAAEQDDVENRCLEGL